MRFITRFFLILAGTIVLSQMSSGEVPALPNSREKLLSVFLAQSIWHKDQKIRKKDNVRAAALDVLCDTKIPENCNLVSLRRLIGESIVRNKKIEYHFERTRPFITIVFADADGALLLQRRLGAVYTGQFQDAMDADCQLYYTTLNNTIDNATIVVSLDTDSLKQSLCLVSHSAQTLGLGLPFNKPFSDAWRDDTDGFSELTLDEVRKLMRSYSVLSYLMMCAQISPGMSRTEVQQILSTEECWKGVTLSGSNL